VEKHKTQGPQVRLRNWGSEIKREMGKSRETSEGWRLVGLPRLQIDRGILADERAEREEVRPTRFACVP